MAAAKIDFKRTLKHLYMPRAGDFSLVDVPKMQFLRVDGMGDPGNSVQYAEAVAWLYSVAYPIKFISKNEAGRDYAVPPLEGIWWADDLSVFVGGDRDRWQWTMMLMQPDWITADMFDSGMRKATKKLGAPPESLRLEPFHEGLSVQILHIGPYAAEAPTIARLHDEFLPERGLVENGDHHEIYLGDPRKTTPEKLKTVLRQPVKRT
jgi:hypothetical protein